MKIIDPPKLFSDKWLKSPSIDDLINDSVYPYIQVDKKSNDDFIDAMVYGIWKKVEDENEEDKEMNKVLELWYERKRNKIIDKYDELENKYNNETYGAIASFNELVEKFNNDLEELYKFDKATEQFVLVENAPNNVIKYKVDWEKVKDGFVKEILPKRTEELKEVEDLKDEINAQLSMSNDLEYQQSILIEYGIIDKKTKRMITNENSSK